MHAPMSECAHLLPPAGMKDPGPTDVFRYNRVVPYYPPDPCIRPTEGELVCPPGGGYKTRNDLMPPAGTENREPSDLFRFHRVVENPLVQKYKNATYGTQSLWPSAPQGPVTDTRMCPCTNRTDNHTYTIPAAVEVIAPVSRNPFQERHGNPHMNPPCPSNYVLSSQIGVLDGGVVAPPNPWGLQNTAAGGTGGRGVAYGSAGMGNTAVFSAPTLRCSRPYCPSGYVCRPVFNWKYLLDCPEQDGPPSDCYTFL